MRAEHWQQQTLELEGWSVKLASYLIGGLYLAEVEVTSSGVTIARATETLRSDAENGALERAATGLRTTKRHNFELMVGG